MKKIKTLVGVITVLMLIIIVVEPGAISTSNQVIKKDPEATASDSSAYVGEMEIYGNGIYETAYVAANAVQSLIVTVDPEGSCVIFSADYYMYCGGWFDGGQVELRVKGADTKVAQTTHEKEGSLYTYLDNCRPGDILEWELIAAYDDLNFPNPIVVGDFGLGLCARQRSHSVTSTPFINQILNKFMDRLLDIFPILRNLADQLSSNAIVIEGTILCR